MNIQKNISYCFKLYLIAGEGKWEKELKERGLTLETARRWAEDRQQWKSLVKAPCATLGTLGSE